jgi:hypothetical protein
MSVAITISVGLSAVVVRSTIAVGDDRADKPRSPSVSDGPVGNASAAAPANLFPVQPSGVSVDPATYDGRNRFRGTCFDIVPWYEGDTLEEELNWCGQPQYGLRVVVPALPGGPEDFETLFAICNRLKRPVWIDQRLVRVIGLRQLKKLPTLARMTFDGSEVRDDDLRHLRELPALTELSLVGTAITAAGLEFVADIPQLTALNISQTNVHAHELAPLARLANLERISLAGVRQSFVESVDGQYQEFPVDLSPLAGLQHLKSIDLSGCNLQDRDLRMLEPLKGIEVLELRGNRIGEESLPWICAQPRLEQLGVESTRIYTLDLGERLPVLARRHLERVLTHRMNTEFTNRALKDCLTSLSRDYQVPLDFDDKAFAVAGVTRSSRVNLSTSNITLRSGLNRLLDSLSNDETKFEFHINSRRGQIMLTTREVARASRETIPYEVSGIARNAGLSPSTVVQSVREFVEPDAWQDESTEFVRVVNERVIEIRHNSYLQHRVEEFLRRLRLGNNASPGGMRIVDALVSRSSAEFPRNPLSDVVEYLSLIHRIRIEIDVAAFSKAQLSPTVDVHLFTEHGESFGTVLDQLLPPLGLGYSLEDDVLMIAPRELNDEAIELFIIAPPLSLADNGDPRIQAERIATELCFAENEGWICRTLGNRIVLKTTLHGFALAHKLLSSGGASTADSPPAVND